jgi:maltokinase
VIPGLPHLLGTVEPADLLPQRRAAETARISMPLRAVQAVELPGGASALAVLEDARSVRYGFPAVVDGTRLRRARTGDGVAEQLVALLGAPERTPVGLEVTAFHAEDCHGERGIDVDQTNELVVVGERVVVKWLLHPTDEEQPAPRRLTTLARAGFTGTPRPWGLVSLRDADRRILVAMAVEYVPATSDGWEWAVDDVRDLARGGRTLTEALLVPRRLARLVAAMHVALSSAGIDEAGAADVQGWLARALSSLHESGLTGAMAGRIGDRFAALESCAGTPVMDVHGDLHIGQILRSARTGEYYVIDFDGNPTLTADERLARAPAARDVAGMLASLDHVGRVVLHRTDGLAEDERLLVLSWIEAAQSVFLDEYRATLAAAGVSDLLDPRLLLPFQLEQECREYAYAHRYLPHWTYVPDAALPALLDRGPS